MKETMTYHCGVQRAERVQHIIDEVGLGQIIREKYVHTIDMVQAGKPGIYICITDTGVTLVKDELKTKIITMYVTTQRELVNVFGGQRNVPSYLRKKVDYNQSKFTQNGKTIWR